MRTSMHPVVLGAIATALSAAPALGQPLVEPVRATGSFSYTTITLPQPSGAFGGATRTETSGSFASGNTGFTGIGAPASTVGWSAHYDILNFWQFPIGSVNTMHATGHAEAALDLAPGADVNFASTAVSYASVTFRVTEPVLWTGTGSLAVTHALAAGAGAGVVGASFRLTRGMSPIQILHVDAFAVTNMPLSFSGELGPGEYTLALSANASTTSSDPAAEWRARAAYDLRVDFTPVPGPGAGLAVGVAAVIARRRRRSEL